MKLKILYNCLAASRLVSKGQHKTLNVKDTLTLKLHLAFCKCCQSFQADLDFVKGTLLEIDEKGEKYFLNPNFKNQLQKIVLREINK